MRRLTLRHTLPHVTGVSSDLLDDAAAVLNCALNGDRDAVIDRFGSVLDRSGPAGGYGLAWCLAATMVGDVPSGRWTLDFPDIDQAAYDARWVARFVSAYVNSDGSTGQALFDAALADGQLPDCILMLVGSAIATLRRRGA